MEPEINEASIDPNTRVRPSSLLNRTSWACVDSCIAELSVSPASAANRATEGYAVFHSSSVNDLSEVSFAKNSVTP